MHSNDDDVDSLVLPAAASGSAFIIQVSAQLAISCYTSDHLRAWGVRIARMLWGNVAGGVVDALVSELYRLDTEPGRFFGNSIDWPGSTGEVARLTARVNELEAEVEQLHLDEDHARRLRAASW